MSEISNQEVGSQDGPIENNVRAQIVATANEHFRRYGYSKTTMSDIAKAVGFSKAHLYNFFDSKQAIGEVICAEHCIGSIVAGMSATMAEPMSASERFRRMFLGMVQSAVTLFFADEKLYEIAATSAAEQWQAARDYDALCKKFILEILKEGRASGEFERKTPIDEAVRTIFLVMQPFVNPLLLQHNLDLVPDSPREIISLVLRSLAP